MAISTSRYQRERRITAMSWAGLLVIIAVVSAWAHFGSRTSPDNAAMPNASAPPMRVQLGAWLTESERLIHDLVTARNNIAAAAAQRDLTATGAACRTATNAVANLHRKMPSPEPTLNSTLEHAITSYDAGLPHCISAARTQDGPGLAQAASYITEGDDAMRAALDFLGPKSGGEPRVLGVLIV